MKEKLRKIFLYTIVIIGIIIAFNDMWVYYKETNYNTYVYVPSLPHYRGNIITATVQK